MKNYRFVIRMNASRHDITENEECQVTDLSGMHNGQLSVVAAAICHLKGIKDK